MEESPSIGKNSAAEEYPEDGGGGELLGGFMNRVPIFRYQIADIENKFVEFSYPYMSCDCGSFLGDRVLLFRASKYSDGSME